MIEQALETIDELLKGKIPAPIRFEELEDQSQQQLARQLNEMISFFQEMCTFMASLSKGDWCGHNISSCPRLASPFKELQSRLLHLSWQIQQITEGDFGQRIDFMGEFSNSFNAMIASLEQKEASVNKKIQELNQTIESLNSLERILPICSVCKKIRLAGTDPKIQENWVGVEQYFTQKTKSQFSHSICPQCIKECYPELDSE